MSAQFSASRRAFLAALGASALPALALPGFVRAAGATPSANRILVLIELAGGNDGLNTVVPIRDPAYRGLRPEIGLGRRETLSLDRDTGLHSAMTGMADIWNDGDMQIVEGVGYPEPNRSHFRSIEIWNAGLGAQSRSLDGWVSRAFAYEAPGPVDAEGIVLGGSMGPLAGPGRFSAMRDEDSFLEMLEALPGGGHRVRPGAAQSPLDQVLATYERAEATGARIRARLEGSRSRQWGFPDTDLGEQLRTAARLLDAGVEVPVLKVVQEGYDTHEAQPYLHAMLLGDLSQAVSAFRKALVDMGRWQDVTIVTYSEFGRTARENASGGTDHGTAAPVFVMGGQVRGGLSGQRVSLDRLTDGDLQFTTDYRGVYRAVLSDLWNLSAPGFRDHGRDLRLLRA